MLAQSGPIDIFNAISSGGVIGLLAFIIFSGMKRKWVWGYQLDDSEKRSEEWKALALRGTNLADRATETTRTTLDVRREVLDVLKEAIEPKKKKKKR